MAHYMDFGGQQVVQLSPKEYRALATTRHLIDDYCDGVLPNDLAKGVAALAEQATAEEYAALKIAERIANQLVPMVQGPLALQIHRTACYRERLRLALDACFVPGDPSRSLGELCG